VPEVHVESPGGRLLVTRLRRGPVPLLRYETGDRGDVVEEPCECGFRGPSIARLAGRRAAHFVRADGTRVDAWQLAWVFKHAPLASFQLTQIGPTAFDLALDPGASPDVLPLLRQALERLGFADPSVALRRVQVAAGTKPEPFVVPDDASWRWSDHEPLVPAQSRQEPSGSLLSR
jgi:hypothetical protein